MTADTNYPDTAESGETYDVERGSAQASLEGQVSGASSPEKGRSILGVEASGSVRR